MKFVTVFFDIEGSIERPYIQSIDVENVITRILDLLDCHSVRATFNIVGIFYDRFPSLVKEILSSGHEIALHGLSHENLLYSSKVDLELCIARAESAVKRCIGRSVRGFRSPWLLKSNRLYAILNSHGYSWVSNVYFKIFPEAFYRPDLAMPSITRALFSSVFGIWRLKYKEVPYRVMGNLYEIPLLSLMDGDLLGPVNPFQETPSSVIKYAVDSLVREAKQTRNFFNMNFHDWIIGTANRIKILDEALNNIKTLNEVLFLPAIDMLNFVKVGLKCPK